MADVLIVGGGLAGLACALRLRQIGVSFQILEASDGVGGRMRTDRLDGFQLDRGFQALLTAYPECERTLDYADLDLRYFESGALIRRDGRFHRLTDPRRRPLAGLASMVAPIGSIPDKFRLLSFVRKIQAGTVEDLMSRPEGLTLDLLRWHGFSESMIDGFFRPLCGASLLDRQLVSSSRLFRFVVRMLVEGRIAVPNRGIGAIPEQLAGGLPPNSLFLNAHVERIESGQVVLHGGESVTARATVVATDGPEAGRLLREQIRPPASRGMTCLYFAADRSPIGEPLLALNADDPGPVNHVAVMSDVAPAYAPAGAALVAATVLGIPALEDPQVESAVREQLAGWFGAGVRGWRHLRTYRIPHALPDQTAPALDPSERPVALQGRLFVCGDHRDTATTHGVLHSGWRAAQAVAESLAS
jgi:phytoene dehydrogenase-like protein